MDAWGIRALGINAIFGKRFESQLLMNHHPSLVPLWQHGREAFAINDFQTKQHRMGVSLRNQNDRELVAWPILANSPLIPGVRPKSMRACSFSWPCSNAQAVLCP